MIMNLADFLKNYIPADEEEKADLKVWRKFTENESQCLFDRENFSGHVVSSAFVVNREKTKVLMAYHNILQR